jgi:hypothetical protein
MNPETVSWRNVVLKALGLFAVINFIFAFFIPTSLLGKLSIYNRLVPGRQRFPFGEEPEKAYNLSLFNLEAMFASHVIHDATKEKNEYRVILLGDSATWGFLLENAQTLSAQLNNFSLTTPQGKKVKFYNLGYPTISLTKDLLILDHALDYEPDLIIWLTTLEAFPYEKQTFTPLVQNNPERVRPLIEAYGLNFDTRNKDFITLTFWDRTIIGQRRALADLWRLQLYGFNWGTTRIDQFIPSVYELRANDLSLETTYYGLEPGNFEINDLAFDVLEAGIEHAGEVPVLLVNEPIFIANGKNSDLRYNFFYPRWIYDEYRTLLVNEADQHGWAYFDAWNLISPERFTNSAIHIDPSGSVELATHIAEQLHILWDQ